MATKAKRRTSERAREREQVEKAHNFLSLPVLNHIIHTRAHTHIFNTFAVSRTTNLFLLFDLIFKMVRSPLVRTLLLYVLVPGMRACMRAWGVSAM